MLSAGEEPESERDEDGSALYGDPFLPDRSRFGHRTDRTGRVGGC